MFKAYVITLFKNILKENLVFSQGIGICPVLFCIYREEISPLVFRIIFTNSVILSIFVWLFDKLLAVLSMYISICMLFFASATLVKFFEFFLRKNYSFLYYRLGVILPLISVYCNIFKSFISYKEKNICLILWILSNIGTSLGLILSIKIFFGIYQKISMYEIPFPFRGMPIIFITFGLISLIFIGLS